MSTKIVMTKEAALSIYNAYAALKTAKNITTNKTGTKLFEGVFDQYGIPILSSFSTSEAINFPIRMKYNGFEFIAYRDPDGYASCKCDDYVIGKYSNSTTSSVYAFGFYRLNSNIAFLYCGCDRGSFPIDLELYCYNNDKIELYGGILYCYRDSSVDFNSILTLINNNDFIYIEETINNIITNLLENNEITYSILSFQDYLNKPLYEKINVALNKIYNGFVKTKSIDKEDF